jgi:hypothetical protein
MKLFTAGLCIVLFVKADFDLDADGDFPAMKGSRHGVSSIKPRAHVAHQRTYRQHRYAQPDREHERLASPWKVYSDPDNDASVSVTVQDVMRQYIVDKRAILTVV